MRTSQQATEARHDSFADSRKENNVVPKPSGGRFYAPFAMNKNSSTEERKEGSHVLPG
jgi:hypothetical protein